MSVNKNALIRYKTLDNCFRNPGKMYFFEDLIGECERVLLEIDPDCYGISRRQIFDDIAFMESSEGWNIELMRTRVGKKFFYRYADMAFSINNMPLNEVEITQLEGVLNILSQFEGMPQFEWIYEILPKLKQGITSNTALEPIMGFDSNQFLKGIGYLGQLYNAILYKKVLTISYQPFMEQTPVDFILHPYFLKQYNGRWFLFGFNPETNKYDWNLALDRIVSMKEMKGVHKKNTAINWQEYFDDIIGVTKPADSIPEKIILHFKGTTGKYMETKPIHGSQKSQWIDPETLEVKLHLIINYEFERLLLSYADTIVIIKPTSLLNKIKERLQAAIEHF